MSGTNGGFGRGRPRFSAAERADILARCDRGESPRAIARDYGCHSSAIYYHLKVTLRHISCADRELDSPIHRCQRCGIDTTRPSVCIDCADTDPIYQEA